MGVGADLASALPSTGIGSDEESYSYSSESMGVEDEAVWGDSAMEGSIYAGDVEWWSGMGGGYYASEAYEDVSRSSWM